MLIISLYLLLLAAVLAKLELQIEGNKQGWAARLPCWKIENNFINWLLGNKPLTGYHLWLMITFFIVFHGYFLFIPWTLSKELYTLGYFSLFWVAEDWFWFLENSYYGLRNFKKGRVYWHKRWIFGLPNSYWGAILLGIAFLLLGGNK